jgi:hypothetical protein
LIFGQPTERHGGNARFDEEVTMASYEGVRVPNPVRARCIRSAFDPSALEDVAFAVSEATQFQSRVYVERQEGLWRWSLVHGGGPYPLHRITAVYLQMDYQAIFVGFRTLPDGLAILTKDPDAPWEPDDWAILEFDGPTSPRDAARRITEAFQPTDA